MADMNIRTKWQIEEKGVEAVTASGSKFSINFDELHDSWKMWLLGYGIAQYIGSCLAKISVEIPAEMKASLAVAREAKAVDAISLAQEDIRKYRALKAIENADKVDSTISGALETLKKEKPTTRTKTPAFNKAEALSKMIAAGLSEETAKAILGM